MFIRSLLSTLWSKNEITVEKNGKGSSFEEGKTHKIALETLHTSSCNSSASDLNQSFVFLDKPETDFSGDLLKSFIICSPKEETSCNFLKEKLHSCLKGKDASHAQIVNQAMRNIGGISLQIQNSEQHILKGMTFQVDDFLATLEAAHAQKVVFTKKDAHLNISALVLDSSDPLIETLKNTGFLENTIRTKEGVKINEGIWKSCTIKGKTYIFTPDQYEKFIAERPFLKDDFNLNYIELSDPIPFTADKKPRKTIILNGGIFSRFESYNTAREVAKFLALGLNVVISEDKNGKDSESHTNVLANREAIYAKLKKEGVSDKDLIWKGTCFSSVPAMEMAARHPGSHVIIDQGYVESKEVVKTVFKGDKFSAASLVPSFIINKFCEKMDFTFSMAHAMKKVCGSVYLIPNKNDTIVDAKEHQKMVKELKKNKKIESLHVCPIEDKKIEHAGGWYLDKNCRRKLETHLIASKLAQPIL